MIHEVHGEDIMAGGGGDWEALEIGSEAVAII